LTSYFDRIKSDDDEEYSYDWLRQCCENHIARAELSYNEKLLDNAYGVGSGSRPAMPGTGKGKGKGDRSKGHTRTREHKDNDKSNLPCFELKNKGSCNKQGCEYNHDRSPSTHGSSQSSRGRSDSSRGSKGKGRGKTRGSSPSARKNSVTQGGVCKFFAQGSCRFGKQCNNSHDLSKAFPTMMASIDSYNKKKNKQKDRSRSPSRDKKTRSTSRDRNKQKERKGKKSPSKSPSRKRSSSPADKKKGKTRRGGMSSRGSKSKKVAAAPAIALDINHVELQTDSDRGIELSDPR
jgi:hypothetical protein